MSANPFQTLPTAGQSSSALPPTTNSSDTTRPPRKRKGHRGGKKKRSRRKSFAVLDDDDGPTESEEGGGGMYQHPTRNLSETSLDSEALLDHRGHQPLRPRRSSTAPAPSSPFQGGFPSSTSRLRSMQTIVSAGDNNDPGPWGENAPLLGESRSRGSPTMTAMGGYGTSEARSTRRSNRSSPTRLGTSLGQREQYDINNPPSMPGSPRFGTADRMDINFGDAMLRDELSLHDASILDYDALSEAGAAVRDHRPEMSRRLPTVAEKDVCFPGPGMSEVGDDETQSVTQEPRSHKPRRRRGPWPDLSALEDFSRLEKEGRTEERRVKKVIEPQLINGRLRPVRKGWSQSVEESPYRFTYFNEDLQSTIHSQTISELVQPGASFQELFLPDPPILSDSDDSDVEMDPLLAPARPRDSSGGPDGDSKLSTRQPSMATSREELRPEGTLSPPKDAANTGSRNVSGRDTPSSQRLSDDSVKPTQTTTTTAVDTQDKAVRYGDRPVWWLDVLCPTEEEMRVLTKAFGIHPLTAEDILVQDPREKVELFRNYYFVNYRTFNQDSNSEAFLEAVDMYVIVFREGVISFHFALTPHAANVRRRIRQLQDYVFVSSDWISYALIDDITDAFQPLAKNIEMEVDEIDDRILLLHSSADQRLKDDKLGSSDDDASSTAEKSGGDMLQRVGDCRKRVMNLYRLLGNKADVIKGFAKRCNERWDVAPRSDIGLYLGDIQDHIVTMTSNLNHYEGILARAHANYLAQINIRMNERQEQTADVLGKLTVLGTIVLPMNIITGLWGMNVWVPGQEYEGDLTWFVWITAGLLFFGLACFMIAKRVYNIV